MCFVIDPFACLQSSVFVRGVKIVTGYLDLIINSRIPQITLNYTFVNRMCRKFHQFSLLVCPFEAHPLGVFWQVEVERQIECKQRWNAWRFPHKALENFQWKFSPKLGKILRIHVGTFQLFLHWKFNDFVVFWQIVMGVLWSHLMAI